MPSKKWKWECGRRGHEPITTISLDKIIIAEKYFEGNVCRHCGSLYYFPNGETVSPIILT